MERMRSEPVDYLVLEVGSVANFEITRVTRDNNEVELFMHGYPAVHGVRDHRRGSGIIADAGTDHIGKLGRFS